MDNRESGFSFTEMEFRDMEATPQYLLATTTQHKSKVMKKKKIRVRNLLRMRPASLQLWSRGRGSERGSLACDSERVWLYGRRRHWRRPWKNRKLRATALERSRLETEIRPLQISKFKTENENRARVRALRVTDCRL